MTSCPLRYKGIPSHLWDLLVQVIGTRGGIMRDRLNFRLQRPIGWRSLPALWPPQTTAITAVHSGVLGLSVFYKKGPSLLLILSRFLTSVLNGFFCWWTDFSAKFWCWCFDDKFKTRRAAAGLGNASNSLRPLV